MNKTQIFTLLVIAGLIILGIVGYFLLIEIRSSMREKAKYEAIQHGLKEAKGIFGRFNNRLQ